LREFTFRDGHKFRRSHGRDRLAERIESDGKFRFKKQEAFPLALEFPDTSKVAGGGGGGLGGGPGEICLAEARSAGPLQGRGGEVVREAIEESVSNDIPICDFHPTKGPDRASSRGTPLARWLAGEENGRKKRTGKKKGNHCRAIMYVLRRGAARCGALTRP